LLLLLSNYVIYLALLSNIYNTNNYTVTFNKHFIYIILRIIYATLNTSNIYMVQIVKTLVTTC